ncbi:Rv3235 family protein [Frigoribacterium faeni]|uniref:Rv3235 family protein n=1 Tax=Frigoribacterium faeni TaxID=145483 RepID=UPI00141B92AE|nr:Rv3235 family protein [Frigoribacterium faeni]NIJ04123.1 hypothetical protein [Frigoribacterium faeni]
MTPSLARATPSEPRDPEGHGARPAPAADRPRRQPQLVLVGAPVPDDPAPVPRPSSPPEPALDPAKAAEGLARSVLEVLAGARDLQQLTRWVSTEVHAVLSARVQVATRARNVVTARPIRPVLRISTVKIARPVPGVVEAVVVVHGRGRARAVAVRLEVVGTRWQASALHIL